MPIWKRPLCISEIGGNHEGCFQKAIDLVELALETPADAVKLQTYFADSLVDKKYDPDRWYHFKKFELTLEQHIFLARKITDAGKIYLTSIWDQEAYQVLEQFLTFVKIGSGDMNSYSFLKMAAHTKLPIILSTGLSTFTEVAASVDLLRSFNDLYKQNDYLTLLQCTSMYPIPFDECNLSVMNTLKTLKTRVGYSDHTIGMEALKLASVLSADVLEFHFTDRKHDQKFRDHQVSLDKDDVIELYEYFNSVAAFMGSDIKEPTQSELANNHTKTFRRGTYVSASMKKGEIITEQKVAEKRPENKGLKYYDLMGKRITKNMQAGDVIFIEDVQNDS
jgi:N-acetylneuraminate synthase/N,N'-diacetyllegionaminate synthase